MSRWSIAVLALIDDPGHILDMVVVCTRRGKPRALCLIDHADIDHLQDVVQNDRLYYHALARNDLDHLLQHEAVHGLMDRRPAETEERRYRCLVEALAWLELAGDDAVLDCFVGLITQGLARQPPARRAASRPPPPSGVVIFLQQLHMVMSRQVQLFTIPLIFHAFLQVNEPCTFAIPGPPARARPSDPTR